MILINILILSILSGPVSLREEYRKAADKNITAVLGAGKLEEIEVVSGKEYFQFIPDNDAKKSVIVFSSAKGRNDFYDYMIIINTQLEIIDIKILKYRSEYGYEIANKGWLKQFYSKPYSSFEYRKNVDALSGATFSAQSLVDDVNLILAHLKK